MKGSSLVEAWCVFRFSEVSLGGVDPQASAVSAEMLDADGAALQRWLRGVAVDVAGAAAAAELDALERRVRKKGEEEAGEREQRKRAKEDSLAAEKASEGRLLLGVIDGLPAPFDGVVPLGAYGTGRCGDKKWRHNPKSEVQRLCAAWGWKVPEPADGLPARGGPGAWKARKGSGFDSREWVCYKEALRAAHVKEYGL